MLTTYKVNMDFWKLGAAPRINAVQGDGVTRNVVLSLYENGQAWQIPEGINVVTSYMKADGFGGKYDAYPDGSTAWSVEGNTITVGLVPQMFTTVGAVKMSIALVRGDQVLHTFPLYLNVRPCIESEKTRSGQYCKIRGFLPLPQNAEVGQMLVVNSLSPTGAVVAVEGRDCPELVQQTGSDETAVMSQKAVTEALLKASQIRPRFANSVEECTDQSALYVLPDGNIYAYVDQYIIAISNVYDPDTAMFNYRINSSGSVVELDGALLLPMEEVEMADPYTVNITGVTLQLTYDLYVSAVYYDASGVRLGQYSYDSQEKFISFAAGNYTLNLYNSSYPDAAGVRLWLGMGGSTAISEENVDNLRVEFVPKNRNEYVQGWVNTGHAFVPADYEDRILALEKSTQKHAEKLMDLQAQENVSVPSYWEDHLEEKIAAIRALQEHGGKDCFSFAAVADLHESANLGKCTGALARRILDGCDIKHALVLGDTATRSSVTEEADMEASFARAEEILAPIRDRALQTRGNHDGCWDDDGVTYYIKDFTPGKLHSLIWRKVGMVGGVTMDDTGMAYYVDDPANRVRYILLNSHYAPYEENADGSAKHSTFRNARFGQQQYDWLVRQGLDVPAGWGIIVGSHVPLNDEYASYFGGTEGDSVLMRQLLEAYNARLQFHGTFSGTMGWDAVDITADFTNAAGEVIAAVAGHSHSDGAWSYKIPVITSRCDAAEENDEAGRAERVKGTVTEHSFDIFTVDRSTRTIYATKIGAGENRVILY